MQEAQRCETITRLFLMCGITDAGTLQFCGYFVETRGKPMLPLPFMSARCEEFEVPAPFGHNSFSGDNRDEPEWPKVMQRHFHHCIGDVV